MQRWNQNGSLTGRRETAKWRIATNESLNTVEDRSGSSHQRFRRKSQPERSRPGTAARIAIYPDYLANKVRVRSAGAARKPSTSRSVPFVFGRAMYAGAPTQSQSRPCIHELRHNRKKVPLRCGVRDIGVGAVCEWIGPTGRLARSQKGNQATNGGCL